MAVLISIETSTTVCSVALSKDGKCLIDKTLFDGPSHATHLSVFIQEILYYANKNKHKIDAVAVSCGPGSYTGLRIGVSTAKGLCYGLNIPLISVNTLEILANTVVCNHNIIKGSLLCPMIDARRMEVYTSVYNTNLKKEEDISAKIIDEKSFSNFLSKNEVIFFGNGANKCKEAITHANAKFLDEIHPIAKNMIILAEASYSAKNFEDVAYFEPFYLKEFVTTTPKKKLNL